MQRPHLIVGPTALLAITSGAIALLVDPGAIPASSAALIAFGLVVVGVTALAGLLLARAPWGRWGLAAAVVAAMALASSGATWWTWTTYAVGGVALIGLLGPWLTLWTRHGRLAEAPGPVVIVLTSVAAGAPLFVGVASVGTGASWYHWALVALTMATSVLYGRSPGMGRWLYRIAVPVASIGTAVTMADPGGAVIATAGVALGVLAWTPAARRATAVVAPVLPTPVARRNR